MSSVGSPKLLKRVTRRDIVKVAIELIYAAWPHVCKHPSISTTSVEPEIAGALYNELWEERRRRKLKGPPFIVDEASSRSRKDRLIPDGRIDFKLIYAFGSEQAFLSVECKRVSSTSSHFANYYVRGGVVRFTSGFYARGHDWAVMLGFVIDKNLVGSISRIEKRLHQIPSETHLVGKWGLESELLCRPDLYRSRHKPTSGKRYLNILHIFVVV